MAGEIWLIIASGCAACGLLIVGAVVLTRRPKKTYVPKHSGEFPIVPVPHVGATDSQATSQWVAHLSSVPSLLDDPYIALRSAEEQLRLALARREDALKRVAEFEAARDAKTFDAWSESFEERLAKAGQREQRTFEWTVEEFRQIVAAGAR